MNQRFKLPEFNEKHVSELCSLCDTIESKLNSGEDAADEILLFNSKVNHRPEPMEFTTYYGSCSTEEFVKEKLRPIIEKDASITKADYISLIEAVQDCDGSETEMSYWIDILKINLHSKITDLIYWSEEELTAEEIYKQALSLDKDPVILL